MIDVALPFHTLSRLLAFVKFHEWHEPRPGYVVCPECKINFEATPIENRHHRAHCIVPALIKELQAIVIEAKAEEGSTMPFPKTREALQENGYVFSHTKTCEACEVTIEMWTTPKNNLMPLDFKKTEHDVEVCEPHFATCKKPELYSRRLRDKKEKAADPPADDPPPTGLPF